MQKEIIFGGMSTTPDDSRAEQGSLALVKGLVNRTGTYQNFMMPTSASVTIGTGYHLWMIHKINGTTAYYIVTKLIRASVETDSQYALYVVPTSATDIAQYITDNSLEPICTFYGDVLQMQQLGNVATIITKNEMFNLIYRDGAYVYLGSQVPMPKLDFQLQGSFVSDTKNNFLTLDTEQTSGSGDGDALDPIVKNVTLAHSKSSATSIPLTTDEYATLIKGRKVTYTFEADTQSKLHGDMHWIYKEGTTTRTHGKNRKANNIWTLSVNIDGNVSDLKMYYEGSHDVTGTLTIVVREAEGDNYDLVNSQENFNAISAFANQFIYENATDDNKFMHPFFVRYALKLFDGSYIYPSAPMLMIPNTGRCPFCGVTGVASRDEKASAQIGAYACSLAYKFLDTDSIKDLRDNWKDIVTSISIGITEPIMSFNPDATWDDDKVNMSYHNITQAESKETDFGLFLDNSGDDTLSQAHYVYDEFAEAFGSKIKALDLPEYTLEEQSQNLKNLSGQFYTIHEIKLSDIKDSEINTSFEAVDIEDGTLACLATHMPITENGTSLDTYLPNVSAIYNKRLTIGDVTIKKYCGYPISSMMGDCGVPTFWTGNYVSNNANTTIYYKAVVTLSDNATTKDAVEIDSLSENSPIFWFYYPSSMARSLTIYRKVVSTSSGTTLTTYQRCSVDLVQHPTLDGRYWFGNFSELPFYYENLVESSTEWDAITDDVYPSFSYPSRIMQSNAYNPFLLPLSLRTDVGNGTIMGIIPATIALSTNQSGRLPVMAFTTDGVWSLEVGNDGSLSPAQPVTRDVCCSASTIASIDKGVIFGTDRGVMLLVGQESTCLSMQFNFQTTCSMLDVVSASHPIMLRDYLALDQTRISYDFAHQCIYVYNPNRPYAYTFSFATQMWAVIPQTLSYGIASYPECLVVSGTSLYDLSTIEYNSSVQSASLITRPFGLDASGEYKVIRAIRVDGFFSPTEIDNILLYASNDLTNWFLVNSAKSYRMTSRSGTGYRYFAVQVETKLKNDHAITGLTILFDIRKENDQLY